MLLFLAQPKKENNQFKNKEQPELPEKHLHRSPTTKELKKHSTRWQRHNVAKRVAPPWWIPKAPYYVTGMLRQRNMAQMKEQIKTPEKELSNEKIANLSDAEYKTLDAHRMIELSCKMKEEVKTIQNEIKENIQGTNSEGKETGTQINDLETKEKISIQLEQNEETRIQKIGEQLRSLWDNFKQSSIQIIGVTEEEEGEQETENLLEKNENKWKKNSPIWPRK